MGVEGDGQIPAQRSNDPSDVAVEFSSRKKRSRIAKSRAASAELESLHRLPSVRLQNLARLSERLHDRHFKKHFGLSLREGRVIAIVGGYGETSLWRTGQSLLFGGEGVGVVIQRLIKRGLLAKVVDVADRRLTKVVLTVRGRAIHKALHKAEISLNQEWMAPTTDQQRETFLTCLDILTTSARNARKLRES